MDAEAKTRIELVDVSPRDGLQNESVIVKTADKIALIAKLAAAGIKRIEVASFVNARLVPQMADAEAVVGHLPRGGGVTFIGLVLNVKGAHRALNTQVHQLGTVAVASDSFGIRNQRQTVIESVASCGDIISMAKAAGKSAQATISVAFGCPFEGRVPADRVVEIAERLAAFAPCEIALADTIGVAVPQAVAQLVARVRAAVAPIPLRAHFHNTRNTAIANVWAAVGAGATAIDAAVGGIGGCPFAPKATGNVASEDVQYLLDHSGIATGVSLAGLIDTAEWMGGILGRILPGMVSRSGPFPV